jgi:hypothetical protein
MQPEQHHSDLATKDAVAAWLAAARAWDPETAPSWVSRLRADGLDLPDPEGVQRDDAAKVLTTLIDALAARGVFLVHTDHLDDAGLYAYLLTTALAAPAPPRRPGTVEVIDLCPPYGSGIDTMLACHASEATRAALAARGIPLPPRKAPAADRDRTLPRPKGLDTSDLA